MKNNTKYDIKDLEFVGIEKKTGTFTNDQGQSFNYKIGIVTFKSKNYPLVFKAKIDKTLMEYFDEMELAPLADSENGSEFWGDK